MSLTAEAGNRGDAVRSDCFIHLELTPKDGIIIDLKSKVKPLFGERIEALCHEVLTHFGIENARLEVEDKGALDFTLAARLEAAIQQLLPSDSSFLLPPAMPVQQTAKERRRRSRLYLPGNNPKLMINAGIYRADGIILDLEDSVAPGRKEEARYLIRNALRAINFYDSERMVRINQIPAGLNDLPFVVPYGVNLILIPKCESADQITQVNERIQALTGKTHPLIHLMPIIESALGVEQAFDIANAASNVVALAIGLEDYTADLGAQRTSTGEESFYARSRVVNAARAAGIQPIDSVFSNIGDPEALLENVTRSKQLGFVGMGCIHPRQIELINRHFSPTEDELERAKEIVAAYNAAIESGSGVVAVGSKMIDAPVLKRALQTIADANETVTKTPNHKEEHATTH